MGVTEESENGNECGPQQFAQRQKCSVCLCVHAGRRSAAVQLLRRRTGGSQSSRVFGGQREQDASSYTGSVFPGFLEFRHKRAVDLAKRANHYKNVGFVLQHMAMFGFFPVLVKSQHLGSSGETLGSALPHHLCNSTGAYTAADVW